MGSDSHSDGRSIRINFPAQPYERRRELVKQISVWMNESEAAQRSLQRDMLDHARGLVRDVARMLPNRSRSLRCDDCPH